MELIPLFLREMEQEAQTTRKMLERIPDDKYDWQPHPKSMTIRQLATHIAELPTWVTMVLTTDELDFASNPYQPTEIKHYCRPDKVCRELSGQRTVAVGTRE